MTMRELWDEASVYGWVGLYTHEDRTYSCSIELEINDDVDSSAKSGFKFDCPEEALREAITKAQHIWDDLYERKHEIDANIAIIKQNR